MSALIPALIKLLMKGMNSGGGGGGAAGRAAKEPKPELSQLEKNDKYSTKAILEGDMTFGRDGGKGSEFPSQPSYGEVTGGRRR